jgi:hypothetical protein
MGHLAGAGEVEGGDVKLNLRGRYEGGGYVVTAKHWWSPKERKAAQHAARVLAYKAKRARDMEIIERGGFLGEMLREFYGADDDLRRAIQRQFYGGDA